LKIHKHRSLSKDTVECAAFISLSTAVPMAMRYLKVTSLFKGGNSEKPDSGNKQYVILMLR